MRQGYAIEVRALKVVQGLEPELTNQFLIALAECAADSTIDNTAAVQRALANEQPGASPPPRKSVSNSFRFYSILLIRTPSLPWMMHFAGWWNSSFRGRIKGIGAGKTINARKRWIG